VTGHLSLVVLAKAPTPGRSKTRCCPPCTLKQAAELAGAALHDTLATVVATPARRHVLVLDGQPGCWLPTGVEVVVQRGRGLDERLAAAFADVGGPAVLIGMDTPQVTTELLQSAYETLARDGVDAVLGPADDGGFWMIGLRRPDTDAFTGVPMSTARTGRAQLRRLHERGYRVELLPRLRDVDTFADAVDVAGTVPGSAFASTVTRIAETMAAGVAVAS
jgi:rSAM/selenodomain-associated transferase 1